MKAQDLVRVKRGSFITPGWWPLVWDAEQGAYAVDVDGEHLVLDVHVTVHDLREVPITITVELPVETSWEFNGGSASIHPDPTGALITMGPVSGPIDWVDVERAALTLLAILQQKPSSVD